MSKSGMILLITVVLVCSVFFLMKLSGSRIKKYEHLIDPAISTLPNQNMLIVDIQGDPNKSGGKAIKLLFKAYYSLKGVPKGPKMPAPRARWPFDEKTPKDQWVGHFALPIPNEITTLPKVKNPDSLYMYISEWRYGDVAEILHIGPYANEKETIQRLREYVGRQGYCVFGVHEEEYIKGPGMFGKGDPKKYLTIIRYRVAKK